MTKEPLLSKYIRLRREDNEDGCYKNDWLWDMIIADLQKAEKTTVKDVLIYEQGYKEALNDVVGKLKKEKRVGIPYKNGLEKGIEVAESLADME